MDRHHEPEHDMRAAQGRSNGQQVVCNLLVGSDGGGCQSIADLHKPFDIFRQEKGQCESIGHN